MEVVTSAVLVLAGLILLCFGGNWLVSGGEKIARKFHISSFVIGMTIIAYGTSTPELAASIAASGEHSAIILGNVVGSNIANIGMVIGISAILLTLVVKGDVLRKEIPIMIGASLLLVILSLDGEISQYDGVILLGGLGLITFRTMKIINSQRLDTSAKIATDTDSTRTDSTRTDNKKTDNKKTDNKKTDNKKTDTANEFTQNTESVKNNASQSSAKCRSNNVTFYTKNIIMIGVGIGLLYVGAILTVDHAVILAKTFGLSEKVIGLTVIAIGTSLPELITSIVAIKKGKEDIGVGNIIGSNIYNVLMIMGVGAVLGGVTISQGTYLEYGIMLAFSAVLLIALKTKAINKTIGICLAIGYVVYIIIELIK